MRSTILAFAFGIGLLQLQAALPGAGFIGLAAAGALFGIVLVARRRHWSARFLLLVLSALLGFSWAAWLAQERLADQLPEAWEGRDVQLVGVVAALPQSFERDERFEFIVESAAATASEKNGAQALPPVIPERIMLTWYHGWHDDEWHDGGALRPGERWRFTVRLKRPHGNANPHGFDYEAWLFERGIRATGYVRPRSGAQRLDDFVPRPAYAVERLRDTLRSRFTALLPDAPYVGVLIALTVGDQRVIPSAQWKVFNRTGITHLVSIS